MKIKLTPQLSYCLGLWKYSRTSEGLGVAGNADLQQAFLSAAIASGLTSPDKIQIKGEKTFFYHTAYRAFFEKTLERQDEAFSHANDYAAAFLAGLFDAVGGIHDGQTGLSRWDKRDEIVLLRLNFRTKKAGHVLWIAPADQFLKFTNIWVRCEHPDSSPPPPTERAQLGENKITKKEPRKRRVYPDPPPKKI